MKIRIIFKDTKRQEAKYNIGSWEQKGDFFITKSHHGDTIYTNMYNINDIYKVEIDEPYYDPNKRV